MWDIRRGVDPGRLPAQERTVVRFELGGVPSNKSRWWLVFDRGDVDLCLTDPGYPTDLKVSASVRVLTEVWLGHRGLREAVGAGQVRLEGSRALVRAFPRWFALSMFAGVARDAARDA